MKNYFRYSILITLALLMTVSIVFAVPIQNIGTTVQPNPYESNPQNQTYFAVGTPTSPLRMRDGDISLAGDFMLGAITTLYPSSDTTTVQWTTAGTGTGHWDRLLTADGDTTRVTVSTTGIKEDYCYLDHVASAAGSVTSVTVKAVVKRTGGTHSFKVAVWPGAAGTKYYSAALTTTTAYTTVSNTWTTNPATASAWTWAEINSLAAGIYDSCTVAGVIGVTQLYVEVLGDAGYYELNTFTNSPLAPFTISWVDLHMKYSVPATTDDSYKIEYSTDGTSWNTLVATVSGANAAYDSGGADSLGPMWSQIAEPTDTIWDWTDISNLRVRVTATRGGATWDSKVFAIAEVWATIYSGPRPPTSSPALSLQPTSIYSVLPGQNFFIDVYGAGLTAMGAGLWGYQGFIKYDTNILTATEWYTYMPFKSVASASIDDVAGSVSVSYYTFPGDTVGYTGENTTLFRVYFAVDAAGTCVLDLIDDRNVDPPQISELKPVGLTGFVPPLYDSWYGGPRWMSLQPPTVLPPGANPMGTTWHEIYPTYSNVFTLNSWTDNGDGSLSASDQIDMVSDSLLYWFHVDTVTLTIHWTFKVGEGGPLTGEIGKAEPESPMTEIPPIEPGVFPENSRWHQIYGPPTEGGSSSTAGFCRMFTITSFADNGDNLFGPSDQFDFIYDDDPLTTHWAHLDAVSTDIIISQKGPGEGGPIPEFPLGIGVLMSLVALIPVIYIWRTRPQKTKRGQ
jgi:hypothetical protein